jgi:hypothetical protein
MKNVTIDIFGLIDNNMAVLEEDGIFLCNKIVKELDKSDVKVILDFNNISLISPTFLNAAVGQLYGQYNSSFLKEHFGFKNLKKEYVELFKEVVEMASKYFKDRKKNIR